jgi:Sulfotransferase family
MAEDDSRIRVLYIDGAARSGTTILARMIGAQPRYVPVGESVLIWRFGVAGDGTCSCGKRFSACAFWQEVADLAPGIFDSRTAHRYVDFVNDFVLRSRRLPWLWTEPGRRRITSSIPSGFLEDISRLYRAVLAASGASVVVDSSKFAAYRFLLSLVPDLNLTSVQLLRDPRAVAFSWQRASTVAERDRADEALRFHKRNVLTAALDWTLQNCSTEVINRLDDSTSYRLRYEDFVARPQPTIRELVGGSVGLEGLSGQQQNAVDLPEVHIFGNPSRFKVGTVQIRLDDEWRVEMPMRSQVLATAISSPLLTRYGYAFRTRIG